MTKPTLPHGPTRKRKAVSITLTFPDDAHRRFFVGQMTDGLGENHFDIDWDGGPKNDIDASAAPELKVRCMGEYWEHYKRMKKLGYDE